MKKHDRLDALGSAATVTLCALWALSHVAVKIANAGISPAFQSGLRSLGALLLLCLWSWLRRIPLLGSDGTLGVGLAAGAMFGAEFALIFWALVYTDVARGVIILYTTPFFVALGAHCFVPGERLHRQQVVGLLAAFAGVVIAFADGLTLPTWRALIGDGMMLAAAALWAATTVLVKASKLSRIAPEKTLAYQLAVSGVVLTPFALLLGERGIFDPTALVLVSLAFQIVVVAFASYLVWFALIRIYPASTLSAFTFLTPLFSLVFGAVLLGERVSAALIAALALVAFGIWLVNRPRTTASASTARPRGSGDPGPQANAQAALDSRFAAPTSPVQGECPARRL
ncbi:MAG: DMT family transporter [Bradyrhizobiaceae bacterium]|nr:DMT family transporter [Bradyrhizobiaceae bacterium]